MASLRRAGDVSRSALPLACLAVGFGGACWLAGRGWLVGWGRVGRLGVGPVGRLLALVLACGLCYTPLALLEGAVPFIPQRVARLLCELLFAC